MISSGSHQIFFFPVNVFSNTLISFSNPLQAGLLVLEPIQENEPLIYPLKDIVDILVVILLEGLQAKASKERLKKRSN